MENHHIHKQIAEHVMGWKIGEPPYKDGIWPDHDWLDDPANYPYLTEVDGDLLLWRGPASDAVRWEPTKRIAQAWEIVGRLNALGWLLGMCYQRPTPPGYYVAFTKGDNEPARGEADSIEMALCQVGLVAVGLTPPDPNT